MTLNINVSTCEAVLDGVSVRLTPIEWALYEAMWTQGLCSQYMLWCAPNSAAAPTHIKWHIARLRRKLGFDSIVCRRGFGYHLNTDVVDTVKEV